MTNVLQRPYCPTTPTPGAATRHGSCTLKKRFAPPVCRKRRDPNWHSIIATRALNGARLLTIARHGTLVRWHRDLFRLFWRLNPVVGDDPAFPPMSSDSSQKRRRTSGLTFVSLYLHDETSRRSPPRLEHIVSKERVPTALTAEAAGGLLIRATMPRRGLETSRAPLGVASPDSRGLQREPRLFIRTLHTTRGFPQRSLLLAR